MSEDRSPSSASTATSCYGSTEGGGRDRMTNRPTIPTARRSRPPDDPDRPMIPTALYRAADVRELDRLAIETGGIAGIDLMERAGLESFRVLRERWPAARRVSVVAGPGNNGGDGFVVARLAAREGLSVSVNLIGDAARLAGDARTAYRRMLDAAPGPTPARHLVQGADVIVDALFGTGLARDVCGAAAGAVHAMNDSCGAGAGPGRSLGHPLRHRPRARCRGPRRRHRELHRSEAGVCSPGKAESAEGRSCTAISACRNMCSRG